MRAVVTGGGGFVGSQVCGRLLGAGCEGTGYDGAGRGGTGRDEVIRRDVREGIAAAGTPARVPGA